MLALIATACALVLSEGLLRLIGFSYAMYPTHVEFATPTPQQIESGFVVDPDLFWVMPDYAEKLTAARARPPSLVVLGDSCTAWGDYAGELGSLVSCGESGARLRYVEAATPAWSSYQGLRQLERDILPLQPRVVTAYFGWNDHWRGLGIQDKDVAFVNSSALFEVQKHSRLAQLVARMYVALSHPDEGPLRRVSPEDFRSNLTRMARLTRERGIALILITAPSAHEAGKEPPHLAARHLDDLSELVPLHRSYVEIVREVAAAEDVILCDLARSFEQVHLGVRRTTMFHPDGIHLREAGDRRVAAELYSCLKEHGLLPQVVE